MRYRKWIYAAIVLILVFDVLYIGYYKMKHTRYADLIIHNGRIVTMDDRVPEIEALAAADGKIIAAGSLKKVMKKAGRKTRMIDLKGAFAVPGLIESHGHLMGLGESMLDLDLTGAADWERITAMVAEAAAKAVPGEWIIGRGWHQDKWARKPVPDVEGLPLHDALSTAAPNNPVLLTHASGHSALVNARAMEISGISAASADPPGGRIIRDASGRPTGALIETAQDLVNTGQGGPTAFERRKIMEKQAALATAECLVRGITTFHDAGASYDAIDVYKEMARTGHLPIRLYVMINESNEQLIMRARAYRMINAWDYHLTVRCIKRLIDGALGARGAWMLEPYTDLPSTSGLNVESLDTLKETADFAIRNGYQMAVHAIGDRANREILNIYEAALKVKRGRLDFRWRIEHAQHLDAADIPRFRELGVVAAMQGIHCTSDGPWVPKRVGPKRAEEGAYVWRKLLDQGVVVSNGTDVPVEREDPIACFYASVTRKTKDGQEFYPAQKMTREEALRSYTINGAFAGFEDGVKGSLVKDKLADITVLSRDLLTCPEDQILSTEVLYTIIGGKVLYEKKPA